MFWGAEASLWAGYSGRTFQKADHTPCVPFPALPTSLPLRSTKVSSPGPQTDPITVSPCQSTELVPYLLRRRSSSGEGTAAVQLLTAVCCPLQGRKERSVMIGHTGSSSLCPDPPRQGSALLKYSRYEIQQQILLYQQVLAGISRFHGGDPLAYV